MTTEHTGESGEELVGAAVAVDYSFKWIRRVVASWLVAVFLLIATFQTVSYLKLTSVEHITVTHDAELSQTLTAACILILHSKPALPVPVGCRAQVAQSRVSSK